MSLEGIDLVTLQTTVVTFIFIFIGVVFNDYTKSLKGDEKIYIFRIVMVSIILTPLLVGLSDKILKVLGNKSLYYFSCISLGWGNYNIYEILNITGESIINYFLDKFKSLFSQKNKMNKLIKQVQKLQDKVDENN